MAYEDFITSVLNVKPEDIHSFSTQENDELITINVTLTDKRPECPFCGGSTLIKEFKYRTYNHLNIIRKRSVIRWKRRRYVCKDCHKTFSEFNPFGPESYHVIYAVLYDIAKDLKNINFTLSNIADRHGLSITAVTAYTDSFLNVPRLHLPENLGIDEIRSDMAKYGGKYLCVLVDNKSRNLIDILPDRSKRTLSRYFENIPKEERDNVRYVTIDMWEPYKDVAEKYLVNAEIAVDPFHVVKHLSESFTRLRISVMNQTVYNSSSYYLLKHFHKLMEEDYDMDNEPKYNSYYKMKMNYRDLYNMIIKVSDELTKSHYLYRQYRIFNKNSSYAEAVEKFDNLINDFKTSGLSCYEEFTSMLVTWRKYIISSFKRPYNDRKQSNAFSEYINGRLKELIIISHGNANFERFRARALYCLNDTIYFTLVEHLKRNSRAGKKRGKYNKDKSVTEDESND